MTPLLSILVCAVARRLGAHTTPLLAKLYAQARGLPVEVLCLGDNYWRTTGAKRNALLALAQGTHVAFVDDDDDVADTYVAQLVATIQEHPAVDLIAFAMEITNDGAGAHIRQHGKTNHNPMHTQVWRRAIAQCATFPDVNFLEDQFWTDSLRPQIGHEIVLPDVLYFYRWQSGVSESRDGVTGTW